MKMLYCVFCYKQKTAYEMRISDWSSDVCSSDLGTITLIETIADANALVVSDPANLAFLTQTTLSVDDTAEIVATLNRRFPAISAPRARNWRRRRSEERRVGNESVSTCSSRWWPAP